MVGEGLRAARERTAEVDRRLSSRLNDVLDDRQDLALVALGAYGRRELTPHAEIELLVLHTGRDVPEVASRLPEAMVRAWWPATPSCSGNWCRGRRRACGATTCDCGAA
jgi:UTP:GlnB (protein PII) uridylyltransferase